jgi:hypothetical protein
MSLSSKEQLAAAARSTMSALDEGDAAEALAAGDGPHLVDRGRGIDHRPAGLWLEVHLAGAQPHRQLAAVVCRGSVRKMVQERSARIGRPPIGRKAASAWAP